jgi:hypothetical protein
MLARPGRAETSIAAKGVSEQIQLALAAANGVSPTIDAESAPLQAPTDDQPPNSYAPAFE